MAPTYPTDCVTCSSHCLKFLPEISAWNSFSSLLLTNCRSPSFTTDQDFSTRSWFGCSHIAGAQTYCSADVPMPNPLTLSYILLSEIQHHMHLNKLLFNVSKPDLLVAHTPSALKNCGVPLLSQAAQKIEVQFDSTLSSDQGVSHRSKVSFQLQNLFKMHTFSSLFFFLPRPRDSVAGTLINVFVSLHIYYFLIFPSKLLLCPDVSSSKAWLQHKSLSQARKHVRANELWLLTHCIHFSAIFFSKLAFFILSPVVANGFYLNFLYSWHVFYSVLMSEEKKKKQKPVSKQRK